MDKLLFRSMKLIGSIFLVFFLFACGIQKQQNLSFQGKLVYLISGDKFDPNAKDSSNFQLVYAKDSMLRVENFTPIGKQIYIKHIPKNRAYILMDLHTRKVAIKSIPEPPPNTGKYKFNKKFGSTKIAGKKAKNIQVEIPDIDSSFLMHYFDDISHKYSEAIPGMPGLPVKYTLFSNDEFMNYELILFEEKELSIDLFGIPSDYTIMTMDEFIDLMEEENF